VSAFRILSIDGGGVRGFLAASILANVEAYLNQETHTSLELGRRFDLISGTSAGGLIALGLAAGRTAASIRDLFQSFVPEVFSDTNRTPFAVRGLYPRYGNRPLVKQLEGFFDKKTLKDLIVDVCVTSVSLIDAKPRLHKTDYLARNAGRLNEPLINVALATTAAPTYFPAVSTLHSANLIDGGIAANNPALVALVDALQFERLSKRGIPRPILGTEGPVMVSVGTGQPGPLPYDYEKLLDGGWLHWMRPIFEVVQLSQSQLVHHQASFLLSDRYLRIDPILNVPVKLDDAKHFLELRNKADIDKAAEDFLKRFLI
jgi:predicted acylesterase/phospholipase RssA